ncbi:GspE/PulE family protein [Macromonas bipunctata]|uniref:GspE/PulE family protein n=1 Tax=Macromonas bipunctata TaxID=183670 RepID=UPI001F0BA24B|nr:GspE/PulE family protein [Macromonas bipunctata]
MIATTHATFSLPAWRGDETFSVGGAAPDCTAQGWTGNALSGQLVDFSAEERQLKLTSSLERRTFGLKFGQFKWLQLACRPGVDATDAAAQAPLLPFQVTLRDGTQLTGMAHRWVKQAHGIWVFPQRQRPEDPFRLFFPSLAVTQFSAEDPLADTQPPDSAPLDTATAADAASADPEGTAHGIYTATVTNLEQLLKALHFQKHLQPVPIGKALVALGTITPEQLDAALQQQRQRARPLGQLLMELGLVSAEDLQMAFARKMGYPLVDLSRFPVDVRALRVVPVAQAMRLKVLPLQVLAAGLVVAMPDPLQFKIVEELEFTTQRKVVPVVVHSTDLTARIQKVYRSLGFAAELLLSEPGPDEARAPGQDALQLAAELTGGAPTDVPDEPPLEQSDNTLVKLINSMIIEAHHQRASDIHIEPYPGHEKVVIRFRIDGELRPYLELPASYRNALIARIKIMCDLDISERRKPQDGKITFSKYSKQLPIELRVATIPTSHGLEDVVMRLLTSYKPLLLQELELSPSNLWAFEHIISRPYGLFLCVGPTGSGKTTTLHSALQRLNQPNRKIWTAEDPVEITQRGLRQIQINARIGWTFAAALRSMLRADPDIIMVGEIRDAETAEIAVESSLTGHLVLSTLHTNTAADTITRLIDLGVDPFSVADSLQGILAQRLVRRICDNCALTTPLTGTQLQELVQDYQTQLPPEHPLLDSDALEAAWRQRHGHNGVLQLRHAVGCEACGHSGFKGRLALHELLVNAPQVRQLLQQRAHAQDILLAAVANGMRTLRQDGIEKVLAGHTTLAEVRSSSNF